MELTVDQKQGVSRIFVFEGEDPDWATNTALRDLEDRAARRKETHTWESRESYPLARDQVCGCKDSKEHPVVTRVSWPRTEKNDRNGRTTCKVCNERINVVKSRGEVIYLVRTSRESGAHLPAPPSNVDVARQLLRDREVREALTEELGLSDLRRQLTEQQTALADLDRENKQLSDELKKKHSEQ